MKGEFEARREIVEVGRRLWTRGYVASNDGNISARLSNDRFLITPTGLSKGFLSGDDLVIVDGRGRKVGGRREPTSELPMHLFVYETRPEVRAVVHAHPPTATGFAAAGVPLAECVLPEVIVSLGRVPLTPYATPSTAEVPESISRFVGSHNALLLRSHGALTFGEDVLEAYYRMETVEHFAEIALTAKMLGGASPLSQEDVGKLLHVRESLGLEGVELDCLSCGACETAAAEPREGTGVSVESAPGAPSKATGGGETPPRDEAIVEAVIERVKKALKQQS